MGGKRALIDFCRKQFGMSSISGADIEDSTFDRVDPPFAQGGGDGVRMQFA